MFLTFSSGHRAYDEMDELLKLNAKFRKNIILLCAEQNELWFRNVAPLIGEYSLKEKDCSVTVEVFVVAPDVEESTFTGSVMVVNIDNGSDYEIIPVSLTTPKNKAINTPFLQFMENHPHLFPLLRQLLRL